MQAFQSFGPLSFRLGRSVDHWSGIHRNVAIFTRRSPYHVPHSGNEGEKFSSHLHAALCLLQSLWGQFWCFRARSASEFTPPHQKYQRVLPSFSRARTKWVNQDLSSWHQRSDCWRLNQGSSSKWLLTSSPPHVWPMSMLKLPLWGVCDIWQCCINTRYIYSYDAYYFTLRLGT